MAASHKNKDRERTPLTSCPFVHELSQYVKDKDTVPADLTSVLQQDNVFKTFYMKIVDGDLRAAYDFRHGTTTDKSEKVKEKHVIIVGAGISGLAAAYELEKMGYTTTILELQHQIGGRIKTLYFDDGLICEAGAMRVPRVHFLTMGYFKRFNIETVKWMNYNPKTYLYLYGEKIRTEDWRENGTEWSTELFKGWDSHLKTLPKSERDNINGIDDYFIKTIEPLIHELCQTLRKHPASGWDKWVQKWSTLSIEEFLRTDKYQDPNGIRYRPWPGAAVEGFRVSRYANPMERSVVAFLRFVIGDWWPDVLEAPKHGMITLPEKFIEKHATTRTHVDLAKRIFYGIKVQKIEELPSHRIKVYGKNVTSGLETSFEGDAVIVTVPLTILRQMDISVGGFDSYYQKAICNVHYLPVTKIALQCRTRFWEKDVGDGGGVTKTTLPIGELYYLRQDNIDTDRGLLLCYSWGQDGQIMASQTEEEAIDSAVRQISRIHPEITTEFERGKVEAWFNDSSEQGGFVQLLPYQYGDAMNLLMKPIHPMYLAGEAISYSHSWIQGALESGLTAAYNLYSYDMKH